MLRVTTPCATVAAMLVTGGGMGPNKLPDGSFILALPTGNAKVSCLAVRLPGCWPAVEEPHNA